MERFPTPKVATISESPSMPGEKGKITFKLFHKSLQSEIKTNSTHTENNKCIEKLIMKNYFTEF